MSTVAGLGDVVRREGAALLVAGREALPGVVDAARERLAGDPARKHARRIARARRRVRAQGTVAGGLAAVSAAAVVAPGLDAAAYGAGGVAAFVGLVAVRSGRRLTHLRRAPVPPAKVPRSSPARQPLDRLTERERALHGLLAHLGETADEPRRVAAAAAHRLRELGGRLTDVHRATGTLSGAAAELRDRLHAGVDAYAALVVAAADAVAADTLLTAAPALQDATDHLAAYATALRALP